MESLKRCTNCGERKPRSEFNKNRAAPDGLQNWCRECYHQKYHDTKVALEDLTEEEREERRRYNRDIFLQREYGFSLEQYEQMVQEQNHRCAICGRKCKKFGRRGDQNVFNVDHCHEHSKVRGLLCQPCNHGIARLGDEPENVLRAYKYLRETHC